MLDADGDACEADGLVFASTRNVEEDAIAVTVGVDLAFDADEQPGRTPQRNRGAHRRSCTDRVPYHKLASVRTHSERITRGFECRGSQQNSGVVNRAMRATQGNEPFALRADSAKGKSSNCMKRTLRVIFGRPRLGLCHRTLLMKWRQCSPGPFVREASYFFRSPRGHASSLANFRDAFGLDQARRVHERSPGAPSILPVSIKEPRRRVHVVARSRRHVFVRARFACIRFTHQSSALRRDIGSFLRGLIPRGTREFGSPLECA
jgi:hypothetical protein